MRSIHLLSLALLLTGCPEADDTDRDADSDTDTGEDTDTDGPYAGLCTTGADTEIVLHVGVADRWDTNSRYLDLTQFGGPRFTHFVANLQWNGSVTASPGDVVGVVVIFDDPLTVDADAVDFLAVDVHVGEALSAGSILGTQGDTNGVSDGSLTVFETGAGVFALTDPPAMVTYAVSETPNAGDAWNCVGTWFEVGTEDTEGHAIPDNTIFNFSHVSWSASLEGDHTANPAPIGLVPN